MALFNRCWRLREFLILVIFIPVKFLRENKLFLLCYCDLIQVFFCGMSFDGLLFQSKVLALLLPRHVWIK